MDVTPTGTTPRRPRTKIVAKEPTAAKPARTTSRKKSTEAEAAATVEAAAQAPVDLHSMIEMAAFYLAAERSFAPGHELDDWLEAERRIRARA